MTADRALAYLAKHVLEDHELDVWLTHHFAQLGRHKGAQALGITPEQFRHRLAAATRKLETARKDTNTL